jgi:ATP-binding cassette subfamily B protein
MNAQTEDAGGSLQPEIKGELCFDHVSFGYGKQKVLDDISFTVPAHTTLGILGTTGSGKSTVLSLLDRLYEVQSGTISIDGVDIRSMDRKWLRRHIGYVIQEPYLFSGTLEENIRISAPEGNMEKMTEIAGLKGTIEHFTDGYQTYVGQRGITLSGGQKQRVAIAQMLMRKTPIMVFDDSLSAVDAKTDRQIQEALQEHNRDTTVLLIGHRISTLKHADQILVMHHGKIIQKGTHEQLIGQPGFYRKVYEIQTGYEGESI